MCSPEVPGPERSDVRERLLLAGRLLRSAQTSIKPGFCFTDEARHALGEGQPIKLTVDQYLPQFRARKNVLIPQYEQTWPIQIDVVDLIQIEELPDAHAVMRQQMPAMQIRSI